MSALSSSWTGKSVSLEIFVNERLVARGEIVLVRTVSA